MKNLVKCSACGREISPNAARCPHCGEPTEKRRTAVIAVCATIAVLLGLLLVVGVQHEISKYNANRAYAAWLREQADEMKKETDRINEMRKQYDTTAPP
jgi:predicted amidophosphoribosyltransferase